MVNIVSMLFRGSSHHHQQHRQSRLTTSSSSSSHPDPASISQSWNYDVFMSFRGEDTRHNFVDHLYAALVQQGIQTYKDDKTLDRGESISPTLVKAIQNSQIVVVVFSENYANSSWCLDELEHIMECIETRGQIVMPIFYHVDPSYVRKQKGKYGKAIKKHQRDNKHKVKSWRKALEKASSISGWTINDFENSYEAICIKEIVDKISNRLPTLSTNINKDFIGIETRLKDLKSKLEIGSDNVRIIGIWGVGGGGKTTLASVAFAEFSHQFEAHCVLQNIREETKKHGLEKLQEKFLSLVLKTKDVRVVSEIEGRSMIERRLCNKSVLVVLDDVDDLEQVEALAGSHEWFGKGSMIIITTRDEHLLTRHADIIHEVSLLSHDEAMELFNKHAYRKEKPIEDYKNLSKDVVSYASGLPLALEILGSFLYDKNKDEWKSTLAKLKDIPDDKVTRRLKISYDGLEPYQKKLFLDITCGLRGEDKYMAMMVLNACSFHPGIGVKVLIQKSLIKLSNGRFDMHDLVADMAHYIVRGEHPNHPEKHSRIWKNEDIAYLCDMGADAPPMETEVLALRKTTSQHPYLYDVVANMKKLRWIHFYNYPTSSFPSNFQPVELRCLELKWSRQKELWHGYKHLPNLKVLNLQSLDLIKTPDFDGLPCLERLILRNCPSLEEIHPSIGYHKKLVFVNMSLNSELKRFPAIIQMKKLETLILSDCSKLQQFPDIQSNMDCLVTLDFGMTGIKIIPPSVGQFCRNLVSFDLRVCIKLKRIEGNFHLLKNLKNLDLWGCFKLPSFHQDQSMSPRLPQFPHSLRKLNLGCLNLSDGDIPFDICELSKLQVLVLSRSRFSTLPSSLSRLPCLKYLDLSYCELVELSNLPSSIAILNIIGCDSLESVVDLSYYKWLWKVSHWRRMDKSVLLSMLEANAVEDHCMSVLSLVVEPSSIFKRLVTLQLPQNWYNDFSGFLLVLAVDDSFAHWPIEIVVKHEISTDHSEEFDGYREQHDYELMGYVPFSSFRHIPWLNPTYTTNISFQADKGYLNVELVSIKSKVGNYLNKSPIDYSEYWDEEMEDKTFEIKYDSKSANIVWRH